MRVFLRKFSTPALLLGLAFLAFGIQAMWLGYYLDDWVFLYHIYRGGYERLAEYSFGVNRPLGAWPWWVGFRLFGYSPLPWHLWALAWRWLTAVLLWMGWSRIWPERKLHIALASALFLVYPIFVQQSAPVTFSNHWMCFALYALSILLMAAAHQNRRLYYPLTALALLSSGVQLFTIEYFVGLEFIRPVLLWCILRGTAAPQQRIRQFVQAYLPYALVTGAFLAWRFLWMPTPGFDRNQPEVLIGLFSSPIQTIVNAAIRGVQDLVEALLGAWYKTYNPTAITLAPVSNLFGWGAAVLAFLLAWAVFGTRFNREGEPDLSRKQSYEWMGISFLVMVAGFLPAWVIDEHLISGGNYADRFGLAAMFGASLWIVSTASLLLRQRHKVVLICALIGLAAGYHFRLANEFRWAWERQSRLAWQMVWRMPGIQPHTAIYGDGTLAAGSWADIALLNFIYGESANRETEDYWYFDLNKFNEGQLPELNQPITEKRFELLAYEGNTSDSLVIQFKTVEGQCLWLVSGDGLPNPYLDPGVTPVAALAKGLRGVSTAAVNPNLRAVFLPEPAHEWCYYFEKAHLAVQEEQWGDVKTLWEEASARGLKTGVAIEYLPFIVGTAKTGDFETALTISQRARALDVGMHDPICQAWKSALDDRPKSQAIQEIQKAVIDELDCGYLID